MEEDKVIGDENGEEMQDFYKLLGISSQATPKEIRTAYLVKAKKYHPDKNIECHNKVELKNMFQKLNEAYHKY